MDWFYCGFDWKLYDQFCEAILHLQVTKALASEGLESFNLIFGFISPKTISGHLSLYLLILRCFLNSIIAKTIADFDEDNLIPFYGFGNGIFLSSSVYFFYNIAKELHISRDFNHFGLNMQQ